MARIKDPGLAPQGRLQIEWAERHMPVVARLIRERFRVEKPLKGVRVGAVLHVTKETAALVRTLVEGGAEVLFVLDRRHLHRFEGGQGVLKQRQRQIVLAGTHIDHAHAVEAPERCIVSRRLLYSTANGQGIGVQ